MIEGSDNYPGTGAGHIGEAISTGHRNSSILVRRGDRHETRRRCHPLSQDSFAWQGSRLVHTIWTA